MSDFDITSAAVTDRGLSEKRPENQDSYLEMPQRGVFAVADGVGGAQAGEVASQMAVEILGEAFAHSADDDPEDTLKAAIKRANSAIYQMANELPQLASMATTIVALHVKGNIATIGHVGDSRLYRVDREGNLHRETEDHSMVAEEVRAGRMTAEQAETHPSRNIISRALGAEADVEVELKTIMIEPGTAFLACSDGITRHVADDEIRGVLTFGGDPNEICEYLKNLCYERGAEDNLTAVVVKVGAVAAQGDLAPSPAETLTAEETTIATARSPFDSEANDALLELDTREMPMPDAGPDLKEEAVQSTETFEPIERAPVEPPAVVGREQASYSIFGDGEQEASPSPTSSSTGKGALALGMLVLGTLIGLAAYHMLLVPETTVAPALNEMRTANIPLSAFEENRRNVDADPGGYIIKFGTSPQDAEDFYLLGRANLLIGNYPAARNHFIKARDLLADADPANAKVIASDIAMGMAVTNDTTIQTLLRKEFEAARPLANTGVNAVH